MEETSGPPCKCLSLQHLSLVTSQPGYTLAISDSLGMFINFCPGTLGQKYMWSMIQIYAYKSHFKKQLNNSIRSIVKNHTFKNLFHQNRILCRFSQSAYIVCVLNFTVFMTVGSLRFASTSTEKYYLISSQNIYKVISNYPFLSRSPTENSWTIITLMVLNVLVSICYFTA